MSSRRQFLMYLGAGTYTLLRDFSALAANFPLPRPTKPRTSKFKPIKPSVEDTFKVPAGFRYDRIASYGDFLNSTGPEGLEFFGSDNDFLAYFPIDALSGGKTSTDGLLWVNHEFISPAYSRVPPPGGKSRSKVREEKLAVGGSVVHVKKSKQKWSRIDDETYTRRFTALYPKIEMTGPVKQEVPQGLGTLGNCSGGHTPWNTVLTCEENFHLFNAPDGLGWANAPQDKIDEREYGYVVEIDPFNELPPKKHSALGKFAHENAALTFSKSGKLVAYMGDDATDEYVYKFVSHETYKPSASRAEKSRLFENGVLYAANFETGRWLALDLERSPQLKDAGFKSQSDIILRTREAAKFLKATPVDRPEDCEVHPLDGSVYIALTNNNKHGNVWGQIVRLVEENDDAEATRFRYEIFLAGGHAAGLSCPDNLLFDKKGNLWVACDMSSSSAGKPGPYESFGNNGLFFVPTSGPSAGFAHQFASGPFEAEITGPAFSPDEKTLFLSVQHPGEGSETLEKLTSHWPDGGRRPPRSSVLAITGF